MGFNALRKYDKAHYAEKTGNVLWYQYIANEYPRVCLKRKSAKPARGGKAIKTHSKCMVKRGQGKDSKEGDVQN